MTITQKNVEWTMENEVPPKRKPMRAKNVEWTLRKRGPLGEKTVGGCLDTSKVT